MTGFGSARSESTEYTASAELKSLNSKFLDLNIRLPRAFSDKELEIRNFISSTLVRGKITLNIEYSNSNTSAANDLEFDEEVFKNKYVKLQQLAESVNASQERLFETTMQLINQSRVESDQDSSRVVLAENGNDGIWEDLENLVKKAVAECGKFRDEEGRKLQTQIAGSIKLISEFKSEISKIEPQRTERIRKKLTDQIKESVESENVDENRLEQELIFYLEKLDITEEMVRIESHLSHFSEIMESSEAGGKKLGFVSQEIGREINTIGAKANDADIQKIVVNMKDELEKIKEQLLNTL